MAYRNYGNDSDESNEVEWNSNKFVIMRLNRTVDKINESRQIRNMTGIIDGLIEFYKEICTDLNPTEDVIWKEIVGAIKSNNPPPKDEVVSGYGLNEGRLLAQLDVIDIKLRRLAKVHGYLASNKDDISGL